MKAVRKWVQMFNPLCFDPCLCTQTGSGTAVTDNTLSASFSGAVLEPAVQTEPLSHLVCKPKSSVMVINWCHYCMGTASFVYHHQGDFHVQKHIEACLSLAVKNRSGGCLPTSPSL